MVRINRMTIVFIMVFIFSVYIIPQDKEADTEKKLREEILAVYQSKGEQGLRDFVKNRKDEITNNFITKFAEKGVDERKKGWLKISEIMAEEKKDKKALAIVCSLIGEYFFETDQYENALEYCDKAYINSMKANTPDGMGFALRRKGRIYVLHGEHKNALEMFNKALKLFKISNNPFYLGGLYIDMSELYIYTGKLSKALEMCKKSLSFYNKTSSFIEKGDAYYLMGIIYSLKSANLKSMELYDRALALFEKGGDLLRQGDIYVRKGMLFFNTGDNEKALSMYDRALDFFKKTGSLSGEAEVYLRKGRMYFLTGQNQKALEMSDKALHLFEMVGIPIELGNIYSFKGEIYFHLGDNKNAAEMSEKALKFYKKINYPIGQGQEHMRKGDIFFSRGDFIEAQKMYDKSLLFFKQVGNIIDQGNIYKKKGEAFYLAGNFKKAFEMYTKALSFYEKSGELRGQGNIYRDKGEIYLTIGDNYKARKMFDRALKFFEKADDPNAKGYVYKRKGDTLAALGKTDSAIEMINKAITFFIKTDDSLGMGNALRSKGDIYSMTSQNKKAIDMYRQALSHYKKVEDPNGEGNVYLSMGNNYALTGNYSKSLEMYEKALEIYEKIGDIISAPSVFHGKAKIMAKLGKTTEALASFEKGIDKCEKLRFQATFSEMKRTIMETVYEEYEETVLFMLENKYNEKGFKYAESMKARVFLDQMAEGIVPLEKGLKPELKVEQDNLLGKFSALTRQLHETSGKEEKKLQELKEEYRRVESQFDDLLIKIRLYNPLYTAANYPQPISVKNLQKKVLKKGEILVCYFISPDKLYVFLISKKKFKVVPLEFKEKRLNWAVKKYQLALIEYNSSLTWRYGKILYRKLFKPLEPEIERSKNVIIIPDGQLATIPFENFIIGKKESGQPLFLLEKYRLKYIQSASILSLLRKHYRTNRETNSFIGFGDPVYDYENFKLGKPEKGDDSPVKCDEVKEIHREKYVREGGKLVRLNDSGKEVNTIAEFFKKQGSEKCVVHIREKATEENAKAPYLKEFDYLHFSCHGILGDTFQSLVLSQLPPDKSKEDGYFTLNEIMNCDYNAKLVVLSACQTGSGKLERAEGVTGMTRAVMYAGTPAVVASLWKVDDEATKELMVKFYENMLEKNLDKAEALRQAKLELIKNKKYRSPLFWSAFVMYGE